MRSFWEEKVHLVVENNESITNKVKSEKNTNGRIRVLRRNMLLPCDYLLDNFNWSIKIEPTFYKKQNKKTASKQLPRKNDNEEERVTENEDEGSEMGEMIEFTPREIQMFCKENNNNIEKKWEKRPESFSVELEKSGQELSREKVVRRKRNGKLIFVDDGSEYCETEGRNMENKVIKW